VWTMLLVVTGPLFPAPKLPVPSAEFKLSITRALADQLAEKLRALTPAPLTADLLDAVEQRTGVYELYLRGRRIYVGKARKDLRQRLGNHLRKLSGRTNLSLDDISFICLYVDEDLDAAAPETLLIKKYRNEGGSPWNTNGFGNKDPGRNRDDSLVKAKHFDALYPIDLDREVDGVSPGVQTVRHLLTSVKAKLPYNLRFETKEKIKSELQGTEIDVPSISLTTREIVRRAVDVLPEGWQATALPGYVILYNEDRMYASAHAVWHKQNGKVYEIAGEGRLDLTGEVEQDADESE